MFFVHVANCICCFSGRFRGCGMHFLLASGILRRSASLLRSRTGFRHTLLLRCSTALANCFRHLICLQHNGGISRNSLRISKVQCRVHAELLHILQHFRCGGVAILDIQCHTLHDDLLQTIGNIGIQCGRSRRAAIDMLNRHSHGRFTVIGRTSGHHLIHDNA